MSSKFSLRLAVPQPPPICRKSVRANANPAWPAWRISALLTINAMSFTGQVLAVNQTFSLPEAAPNGEAYELLTQVKQWRLRILLVRESDGIRYSTQIEAEHPDSFFPIECGAGAFTPIKLEPFNSGIQQLTFLAGTGKGAVRFML